MRLAPGNSDPIRVWNSDPMNLEPYSVSKENNAIRLTPPNHVEQKEGKATKKAKRERESRTLATTGSQILGHAGLDGTPHPPRRLQREST